MPVVQAQGLVNPVDQPAGAIVEYIASSMLQTAFEKSALVSVGAS